MMERIERYGAHAPKKQHGVLTAVLVILAVLLAAMGIVSFLALSDPYAGKGLESVSPSNQLPQTLAKEAVLGREATFSESDVNGYLAYLFREHLGSAQRSGVTPLAVAVAEASGNSAELYLPVSYHGKRLGIALNVTPSIDMNAGKLLFRVNSARVGRLSVPVDWLLSKAESRLPKGFERDGSAVFCSVPAMQVKFGTVSASAGLTTLHLSDGKLTLAAGASVAIG